MRAKTQARPQLEPMEALTLLSGVAATAFSLPNHAEVLTTTGTTLAIGGTARGGFLARQSKSAKIYTIHAAGTLTPIGRTTITGDLSVNLGISSGPPSGMLTLSTSTGVLTLQIPKSVLIPAGLPTATAKDEIVDTFTITNGTGAYKGDTGSGVVELTFTGRTSAGGYQVGLVSITFTKLTTTFPT
jgi:hypothetical protein